MLDGSWQKVPRAFQQTAVYRRVVRFKPLAKAPQVFFPKRSETKVQVENKGRVNELLLLPLPFRETTSVSTASVLPPPTRVAQSLSFFSSSLVRRFFSSMRAHARTCLQIQDDYLFARVCVCVRSVNFICSKSNGSVSRILFIN